MAVAVAAVVNVDRGSCSRRKNVALLMSLVTTSTILSSTRSASLKPKVPNAPNHIIEKVVGTSRTPTTNSRIVRHVLRRGVKRVQHQLRPTCRPLFIHQLHRIVGMMEVDPEFAPMICKPAAHHIKPQCRLCPDMVNWTADACKDLAEPLIVVVNAFIEIPDYSYDTGLPKDRIQLPKLNGLCDIV